MARKSRKNVGLIGLGIIGSRVANALRASGFHPYVWNRTPRPAPNFLASPAEVAELCDVIQLFIADAQALFDVLESVSEKLTSHHVIVCNATVGPEATIEAAKLVQDRGAQFLDAPFTGSKAAAENRQLVYYIGGNDDAFRRAEPILRASSKALVKLGRIGDAATLKVVTNMLAAVSVQALTEALAIVQGSGLAPELLVEALEHHGVRSGLTDMKLPKMIAQDYEPHFSVKHMFKDVQLGIHIGNALDIDLPTTTATAGVMYGALTRGWAELDYAALAKVYQPEPKPEQKSEPADLPKTTPADVAKLTAPPGAEPPTEHVKPVAKPPKEIPSQMTSASPSSSAHLKTSPSPEPKSESKPASAESPALAQSPTPAQPGTSASKAAENSGENKSTPVEPVAARSMLDEPKAGATKDVPASKPEAAGATGGAAGTSKRAAGESKEKKPDSEPAAERNPDEALAGGGQPEPATPLNRIRRWFGARQS